MRNIDVHHICLDTTPTLQSPTPCTLAYPLRLERLLHPTTCSKALLDLQALEKELDSINTETGKAATAAQGEEERDMETNVIFSTYDRNQSGALELDELQECLQDLGALVRSYTYLQSGSVQCSNAETVVYLAGYKTLQSSGIQPHRRPLVQCCEYFRRFGQFWINQTEFQMAL